MISDFGLSTILDSAQSQLSICGTPLYSSPQLLKKRSYSYKVDVWAIGIMCYELLMGRTPFHSYEMKDLIAKINEGKYTIETKEPLCVECALFLTQCLQANETERINFDELEKHCFLQLEKESENGEVRCTILDKTVYTDELFKMTELTQNIN
jgi:serine/threonine-protein kinase ULK/ATG1